MWKVRRCSSRRSGAGSPASASAARASYGVPRLPLCDMFFLPLAPNTRSMDPEKSAARPRPPRRSHARRAGRTRARRATSSTGNGEGDQRRGIRNSRVTAEWRVGRRTAVHARGPGRSIRSQQIEKQAYLRGVTARQRYNARLPALLTAGEIRERNIGEKASAVHGSVPIPRQRKGPRQSTGASVHQVSSGRDQRGPAVSESAGPPMS